MLFSQLPKISKGRIISDIKESEIEFLITDSRNVNISPGSVFFAIKGINHDGHSYIHTLYTKGIRQFVVEEESQIPTSLDKDCAVFLAENTVGTLQDIAAFHRTQFDLEVIGITGSNGKTIVKEWLNQLLSPDQIVVKSPKSYNSQIGVPLSVWQLLSQHELGIFEAGISRPGEMAKLERIIKPTIGIFTNIGPAHSEGFDTMLQKIEEKCELFKGCKKIIYRKDFNELDEFLNKKFNSDQLISWSLNGEDSQYKLSIIRKEKKTTYVSIKSDSEEGFYLLPFTDDASLENVLHCIILMIFFKTGQDEIQKRVSLLNNISMRLELKQGRYNSYIIDDTYNNDPEGLKIALQFMLQQNLKQKKIIILSDMLETGKLPKTLYTEISQLLIDKGIDFIIGIGEGLKSYKGLFPANSKFYPATESFLQSIHEVDFSNSLILIKGARKFRFETIVQALAHKIHRTILEINLNSVAHNLNVFRQMLKPKTKMMVMVKAFAYGSGSHEIAHLLQYNKADYLGVAYTDEGISLRDSNITLPIMVMNPSPEEFIKMQKYNLEPEIYNFRLLNEYMSFSETAAVENIQDFIPPIHIAIDTGMHRLGFEEEQIEALCGILKNSNIKVATIFSHLVGADESEHDQFSVLQGQLFRKLAEKIENSLNYKVLKHLLNSAGTTRLSTMQNDMVRLGIGLYGIESDGHPIGKRLETVSTLKTVISQIRQVKKGDSIGYSRKGLADEDIVVATVAIGYGDGYSRKFSNGVGKMYVNGKLAPIIGNVCMDLCMIDITGIQAEEGDEVIIFGKECQVEDLALSIGTIPYEILTNVSERVKRVFYLE